MIKRYLKFIKESVDQEEIRNIFNDFLDEFGLNSNRIKIESDSHNLFFMIEIKEGAKIAFRIGKTTKKDEFIRKLYLGFNSYNLQNDQIFDEYVEIIEIICERMMEIKYEFVVVRGRGIGDDLYLCFKFKKLD